MNDISPTIFSSEESSFWREAYLERFVDTAGVEYQKRILTQHPFSDGLHYTGYLWECLRSPSRITIQRVQHEIALHSDVLVMADDHSRHHAPGARLWPYPQNSVALFTPEAFLSTVETLPRDIYVFDSFLSWTVVLTHENDGKRQTCCAVGIET